MACGVLYGYCGLGSGTMSGFDPYGMQSFFMGGRC